MMELLRELVAKRFTGVRQLAYFNKKAPIGSLICKRKFAQTQKYPKHDEIHSHD